MSENMMTVHDLTLSKTAFTGVLATEDHFGANLLFTKDYVDAGSSFDQLMDLMDFPSLRFPGGSITEQLAIQLSDRLWDVNTPSGVSPTGEARIVTYPAYLDFVQDHGTKSMLVTPSAALLEVGEVGSREVEAAGLYRILTHTESLLKNFYGEASIDTIMVGNEFWYMEDKMTTSEYASLVNDVSIGLQFTFDRIDLLHDPDNTFDDPDIAMQSVEGEDRAGVAVMLAELEPEARAAIDTLITHLYPREYDSINNYDSKFERIEEFQAAPGFGELKTYVSEWNIKKDVGSATGLMHATGMMETMQFMLEQGVDVATVWGTQEYALRNRLAMLKDDPDNPNTPEMTLTAAGETFRWMRQSVPGTRVMDLGNISPDGSLDLHVFGSDDHTSIFVSSISGEPQEVTLDVRDIVPSWDHFWGQQLGVMDDPTTWRHNEGDPLSHLARPYISTIDASQISADGKITLLLRPYESARLEFNTGDEGVYMYGHDQVVNPSANYADVLNGSGHDDRIEGHYGDDTMKGFNGNDTMDGGDGNDRINGGIGADLLRGEAGNDSLVGGDDNDTLIGGEGDDRLSGSRGSDHFIVDTKGQTTITDFENAEGETISFQNAYGSVEEVAARLTQDGKDLLISHDGGGLTRLQGMAGQESSVLGHLSDFMDNTQIDALVAEETAPTPDGSIAPDPVEENMEPLYDEAQIQYAQSVLSMSAAEVGALGASLDPAAMEGFIEGINTDVLFYTMRPDALASFLNNLSDESRAMLLEDIDPGTVAFRLMRLKADAGEFLNQLDADALEDISLEVGRADGNKVVGNIDEQTRDTLQARIDTVVKDDGRRMKFADEDPEEDPEEVINALACFVANAAYDDLRHPDVEYLRLVRDLILVNHPLGRGFIKVYWKVGPKLASLLAPHPRARALVKATLNRLVVALQRRDVLTRHGRTSVHQFKCCM